MRRAVLAIAAVLCAAGAILGFAAPRAPAQDDATTAAPPAPQAVAQGRRLFGLSCSACHGLDARGIRGVAPSLRGVGELAADFYLRTGRMPLDDPKNAPRRARPQLSPQQIAALVAYVGSFGGPKIPSVQPGKGDISTGFRLFSASCAACHQILGRGGITTGAQVPALQDASATDVAEAMAIGPYVMPQFRGDFDQREIDSLARYVLSTRDPQDVGGWGIGHIGPIPEGMVTWLLAIAALLLVMRLIGERNPE